MGIMDEVKRRVAGLSPVFGYGITAVALATGLFCGLGVRQKGLGVVMICAMLLAGASLLFIRQQQKAPDPVVVDSLVTASHNAEVAERCVFLYEELDRNMEHFDEEKRRLAEHVMARLEEILLAVGACVIRDDTIFDRMRHQPDKLVRNGAAIVETLSPGFTLDRRVLRRARVHIA